MPTQQAPPKLTPALLFVDVQLFQCCHLQKDVVHIPIGELQAGTRVHGQEAAAGGSRQRAWQLLKGLAVQQQRLQVCTVQGGGGAGQWLSQTTGKSQLACPKSRSNK